VAVMRSVAGRRTCLLFEDKHKDINNYILTLLWSLPIVILLHFFSVLIWVPNSPHVLLIFQTLLFSFAFILITIFFYRKLPIIGLAIIGAMLLVTLFGIAPISVRFLFWVGILLLAILEVRGCDFQKLKQQKVILGISVLVIIAILIPYYSFGLSLPFNAFRITNAELTQDTLFHTALASMWKVYHSVSHGMHGLGDLDYHFGSHLLFAGASNLIGISAFESYSYVFVLFFIPLLGVMVLSISEEIFPSKSNSHFITGLLSLGFLMLGTGVLDISSALIGGNGLWPSFFISESYTISIIILMALFSVLLSHKDLLPQWARGGTILVVASLLTMTKVSTGFYGVAVVGSWALLSKEKWWSKGMLIRWSFFLITAIASILLLAITTKEMGGRFVSNVSFPRYLY